MIAFILGFFGIMVGWQIARASEYFPRFAANGQPDSLTQPPSTPALWQWLISRFSGQSKPNKPLHYHLHLVIELVCLFYLPILWYVSTDMMEVIMGVLVFVFYMLSAVIDLKYRLILNVLVFPAIGLVILSQVLFSGHLVSVIIGGVMAFSIFFLAGYLRPGDLGGGDIKLALLSGLLFGFPSILWVFIIGTGLAALLAVRLMLSSSTIRYIPYAPFIAVGVSVALLVNPFLTIHFP